MAVKSDSNYTIIVYYCNTVVIVFNSTVYYRLPSFTVVLESLLNVTSMNGVIRNFSQLDQIK